MEKYGVERSTESIREDIRVIVSTRPGVNQSCLRAGHDILRVTSAVRQL